jgi:hypothetical protein
LNWWSFAHIICQAPDMDKQLALILAAALLIAPAQSVHGANTIGFAYQLDLPYSWNMRTPQDDHVRSALSKLDVKEDTNLDELVNKIRSMAAADNNEHDLFQTLALALVENGDDVCPDELVSLLKSILALSVPDTRSYRFSPAMARFLRAKVVPKLDRCVSSIVKVYTRGERKAELDNVLEPLDGFFQAAYGSRWPRVLPTLDLSLDWVHTGDMISFADDRDLDDTDHAGEPVAKIERFLDDACKQIRAFRHDVDVINLVNAIEQQHFPPDSAPPEARELPEPLLRLKYYSRVCLAWGKRDEHEMMVDTMRRRHNIRLLYAHE